MNASTPADDVLDQASRTLRTLNLSSIVLVRQSVETLQHLLSISDGELHNLYVAGARTRERIYVGSVDSVTRKSICVTRCATAVGPGRRRVGGRKSVSEHYFAQFEDSLQRKGHHGDGGTAASSAAAKQEANALAYVVAQCT